MDSGVQCGVLLQIGIALDETVTSGDLEDLMAVFNCSEEVKVSVGGARTQQKGLPQTGDAESDLPPPADDHC